MIWFSGDQHFGHGSAKGGIIAYCNRLFGSVGEMDEAMIEAWNEVVGKDDTVYHLGDLTLNGPEFAESVLSRLNGHIYVLWYPWHHDRRWLHEVREKGLVGFGEPIVVLEDLARWPIVLCHFPFEKGRWDRAHYRSYHFHAHTHGQLLPGGRRLDVGVDMAYELIGMYRPFSLDEAVSLSDI